MKVDELWALYWKGALPDAEQGARQALDAGEGDPGELRAILAWCAYRNEQYDDALAAVAAAQNNSTALACEAYVRVFSAAHRDDARLKQVLDQLGETVDAANTLVIIAWRSPGLPLGHEQVWAVCKRWAQDAEIAARSVPLANLLHNTGKFFFLKARDARDISQGIGLLNVALAHYGSASNWHHRAAAFFWLSKAYEALGAIPAAVKAANASLELWQTQVEIAGENAPRFMRNLENAIARQAELAPKLLAFTLEAARRARLAAAA